MSGGGKGGTSTTETEVPGWIEDPAKRNLERAEDISKIGYVPTFGPDVAALNLAQTNAMDNNRTMAEAWGLQGGGNVMPTPETFAGGVQGYSSKPLYDEAVASLQQERPGQYNAIMDQFIDPFTGRMSDARDSFVGKFTDNEGLSSLWGRGEDANGIPYADQQEQGNLFGGYTTPGEMFNKPSLGGGGK